MFESTSPAPPEEHRDETPQPSTESTDDEIPVGSAIPPAPTLLDGAPDLPPWTLRQTLIGTTLTLGPWLLIAIGSLLIQRAAPPIKPRPLSPAADLGAAIVIFIVSAVLEGVFLIAPLIYAYKTLPPADLALSRRERLRAMLEALGLRRPAILTSHVLRDIVVAAGVIFGASIAYDQILQRLHSPLRTNADVLLEQAKYQPYTVIATLLVAVLVAPLCEEIFFRGYLFPGLLRGLRPWPAIAASALLFALAHADLGSSVLLIVMGVVLAVVRWRSRSLWPGVILHTLNNTIAFIIILVLLRH